MGSINRKLNYTAFSIYEFRIGNLVKCYALNNIRDYVITGIDGNGEKLQLEFLGTDFLLKEKDGSYSEIYEQEVVSLKTVTGIELWDSNNRLWDLRLKDFEFIAHPRGKFTKNIDGYDINVVDSFYSEESAFVISTVENKIMLGKQIWYLHELQNAIYTATGTDLINDLIRKVLFKNDKPKNKKLGI